MCVCVGWGFQQLIETYFHTTFVHTDLEWVKQFFWGKGIPFTQKMIHLRKKNGMKLVRGSNSLWIFGRNHQAILRSELRTAKEDHLGAGNWDL